MRIRFEIDQQMVKEAKERAQELGVLKKSLMKGERNNIGMLGELQYMKMYPDATSTAGSIHQHDFDFWCQGNMIEVKSQRVRNWRPPDLHLPFTKRFLLFDYMECFEIHQSLTHGWYIGRIGNAKFNWKHEFIQKGTPMPQGGVYRSDGRRIWKSDLE